MRSKWASLLLLLFHVYVNLAAKSCVGPGNLPSDNYCVGETDESTGVATPNCVNVGSQKTPDWRCARCAVHCDCPPGTYCVKKPGPTAGTCVGLAATNKIGTTCTSFALPGTPGARIPIKGVDDSAMCGAAIFDETTGQFLQYEWLGNCISGKCKQCAGNSVAWGIAISAQMIPGMASVPGFETSNGSAWDAGSLVCTDRMCDHGSIVAEAPWYLDLLPTGVITGILVFVIFIFVTIITAAIIECCSRVRDGRVPSILQYGAGLPGTTPSKSKRGQKRGHHKLTEDVQFDIGTEDDDIMLTGDGGKRV